MRLLPKYGRTFPFNKLSGSNFSCGAGCGRILRRSDGRDLSRFR